MMRLIAVLIMATYLAGCQQAVDLPAPTPTPAPTPAPDDALWAANITGEVGWGTSGDAHDMVVDVTLPAGAWFMVYWPFEEPAEAYGMSATSAASAAPGLLLPPQIIIDASDVPSVGRARSLGFGMDSFTESRSEGAGASAPIFMGLIMALAAPDGGSFTTDLEIEGSMAAPLFLAGGGTSLATASERLPVSAGADRLAVSATFDDAGWTHVHLFEGINEPAALAVTEPRLWQWRVDFPNATWGGVELNTPFLGQSLPNEGFAALASPPGAVRASVQGADVGALRDLHLWHMPYDGGPPLPIYCVGSFICDSMLPLGHP